MTTVFTVIRFTTQKKENTINILGTFLNVQSAYKLVEQIYQKKMKDARSEHKKGEPLPDWMNNNQLLFQNPSYYFWGVNPQPVYQLFFPDEDYGEGVAIVQTILQQ